MHISDIAIVGMSGVFPGANDVDTFWENIKNKKDAFKDAPEDRISNVFFNDTSHAVDRIYCKRGGFIENVAFDPLQFGILPLAVEGTEPDHLITLKLAWDALRDADILNQEDLLSQTGIIIGKGNYNGAGSIRAIEIVRTGQQIAQVLKQVLPQLKDEEIEAVKSEYQQKKGRFGPDTAMGVIPNLIASLVANRLNLGGAAYTLDAACASSLIAVDHAVNELSSKRCDAMIAGGVHVCHDAAFWSIFSQLGALSKSHQIRPFDQRADGLLIGEGCGFVVLRRLEDAIKDENKIYAIIKGTGVASDGAGTSVMSPAVKGQKLAIRQAWSKAGIDPKEVDYIEAHGTGTQLGDKTELETLATVFENDSSLPKVGIGSVKSMIGHAMPAAGIAGLIKMAKALHHGIMPPTLHCDQPLEAFEKTRFQPIKEPINWEETKLPKRVGINAFGFGGINAHVVMEGFQPTAYAPKKAFNGVSLDAKDEVLLLARTSNEALLKALENKEGDLGEGDFRIAIFDPTPTRIKKALKVVSRNAPWRNRNDIWYTNAPLLKEDGKIAFLFPGLDALKGGETESIQSHFSLDKPNFPPTNGNQLLAGGFETLNRSRMLDLSLKKLGVKADINAGHSFGEWLAGWSAELVKESSLFKVIEQINPGAIKLPKTRFLAVGTSYESIKEDLDKHKDIYLSNDNCPQQIILCGTIEATDRFVELLKKKKVFHQILPFDSGFHSPFLEEVLDQLLETMDFMEFQEYKTPVWSATTLSPYPEEHEAIKQLNIKHLIEPVRFRELTLKLYDEGVKVFIQVGSGGLVGYVDDTLKTKEYSAISASKYEKTGLCQLQRVIATLFIEGKKDLNLSLLVRNGSSGSDISKKPSSASTVNLKLGSPLINNLDSLNQIKQKDETKKVSAKPRELTLEQESSPVMRSLGGNFQQMVDTQNEVLAMLAESRIREVNQTEKVVMPVKEKRQRLPVTFPLDITLENSPYLIDHSLMKQKPGWKDVEDLGPVIPFTMMMEIFGEVVQAHVSNEIVQKVQNIRVFQWMGVATPFRETIEGNWKNNTSIFLNLEKYAQADVLLAPDYRPVPSIDFNLGKPLGVDIPVSEIYVYRMFHGPAYQGIKAINYVGENGMSGVIEGSDGKGSLLDNAGQLYGLWLQFKLEKNRIAFPVKVGEIEYFEDPTDQSGSFECSCELTELNDQFATANIVLKRNGSIWALITGWQNRRLELDEKLWNVSMAPEQYILSDELVPAVFLFHNAYQKMSSWDFIIRRYFNKKEREYLDSLLPNKRKEWIISRVVTKDAVRKSLEEKTGEIFYPLEYEIQNDTHGKPFAVGEMIKDLNISISHKKDIAVAMSTHGKPVGIDIEVIEERSKDFESLFLNEEEMDQIPENESERSEWITRFWVAKEAYGKSLGKGLEGNPKQYKIKEVQEDELHIENTWIQTIKHKNYIIGWTK